MLGRTPFLARGNYAFAVEELFDTSPLPKRNGRAARQQSDAANWPHFVRVAVERGIERLSEASGETNAPIGRADIWEAGVLTYRSPHALSIGTRVEVPLGRGNTVSGGIVLDAGGPELAGDVPLGKVKGILGDTGAGLPASLVELAKWMAGYYVCPVGMVLAIMMPSAVKNRIGNRQVEMLEIAGDLAAPALEQLVSALKPAAKETWERVSQLPAGTFPVRPERLLVLLKEKTARSVNQLLRSGLLRRVEIEETHARGGAPIGERVEERGTPLGTRSAGSVFTSTPANLKLSPDQTRVVEGIGAEVAQFGVHLLRGVTGSGKTEVYLRLIEQLLESDPTSTALMLVPEISLTPQMGGRFEDRLGHHGVAVLHSGLSASQRNKQWLRATLGAQPGGARVVVGARSAVFSPSRNVRLIVVDEEHASDYKQDQLPRYHGRDVAIKRAQIEGCPVILGSATPSLESWANAVGVGLSIPSTPPSPPSPPSTPHARSSNPPPTSATGAAKYKLWELPTRVGGARLPRVEIVDLTDERKEMEARRRAIRLGAFAGKAPSAHTPRPPSKGGLARMVELGEMIGPTLEHAIAETLSGGGQAVLLLNRRGYAGYIACADATCGWVLRCDDCDAGLVFHKVTDAASAGGGRVVRCHHCLAQQLLPAKCPTCHKGLIWLGLGTQRVEEEVADKFAAIVDGLLAGTSLAPAPPPLQSSVVATHLKDTHERTIPPWIVRVDGDTMQSAKDYFDVLGRFAKGEIKVLVGTQMIAKGLDFPNVRLVGVINADTALGLADFRSMERTFQLVSQVAGRAGRSADRPGRVIVQTMEPTSPAIVHAANHDYVTFATEELDTRLKSGLPPVTKMARIVVRDEVFDRAMKGAAEIGAALRRAAGEAPLSKGGVRIMGPMECPIGRIAGFYRVGLELTALRRGVLQQTLSIVRSQGMLKGDARTAIDIDPIALL